MYLQQEQVLTELYSHIYQDPPPADVDAIAEAHKFLEACNLLFEKRFLSHEKIFSMNSILHGFNDPAEYFKWLPVFYVMALNTVV